MAAEGVDGIALLIEEMKADDTERVRAPGQLFCPCTAGIGTALLRGAFTCRRCSLRSASKPCTAFRLLPRPWALLALHPSWCPSLQVCAWPVGRAAKERFGHALQAVATHLVPGAAPPPQNKWRMTTKC